MKKMLDGMRENGRNLSFKEGSAKRLLDLVKEGKTQAEAEQAVGTTLAKLKKSGELTAVTMSLIARAEETGLLKTDESIKKFAKARLIELASQDEDLGVAARAAKTLLTDGVKIAVQINNNAVRDEKVLKSLQSLGIMEVENEI